MPPSGRRRSPLLLDRVRRLLAPPRPPQPATPSAPPMMADDIIASVAVDPDRIVPGADAKPAQHRFFFYFTPRSGSSWLATAMRRTNRLGFPDEWFNLDMVPRQAAANNVNTLEAYIDALLRRRQSPNSVFVMKISPFQLNMVRDRATFFRMLPADAPSVFLIRENVVRQAISLYKAVETDIFHTINRSGEELERSRSFDAFDGEKIMRWLRHITEQERIAAETFAAHGIRPLVLSYEWVFAHQSAAVPAIAAHFGIELAAEPRSIAETPQENNPHTVLSSRSNAALEAAFRTKHRATLREMEAARAPLVGVVAHEPVAFPIR